mmetsp:Transcript_57759/g.183003  ORF Transcript_57759/g.183003 Transcript_57759/m.183003 type:complete len:201 (+) Transcript_57759:2102-2704(+)
MRTRAGTRGWRPSTPPRRSGTSSSTTRTWSAPPPALPPWTPSGRGTRGTARRRSRAPWRRGGASSSASSGRTGAGTGAGGCASPTGPGSAWTACAPAGRRTRAVRGCAGRWASSFPGSGPMAGGGRATSPARTRPTRSCRRGSPPTWCTPRGRSWRCSGPGRRRGTARPCTRRRGSSWGRSSPAGTGRSSRSRGCSTATA